MADLKALTQSIIEGDSSKAVSLTNMCLKEGIPTQDILDKALLPGIREVGKLFSTGKYFLPELLIAGDAMKSAVEELKTNPSHSEAPRTGKFLIGTVHGDVHDVGKNIVIMMLELNGWEVTDLGVDVPPEQFCTEIKEGNYDIVGLSALLTLTMSKQAEIIRAMEDAGLRNKIKVMIGGAPVTQDFANQIGADAYGINAIEAVEKAATLVRRG